MAEIKVSWTKPAEYAQGLGNVNSFLIYWTKATAHLADAATACTALQALANTIEVNDGAGVPEAERVAQLTTNLDEVEEYTDTGVGSGSYRYGVFSWNSGGANACQLNNGSVSDTVLIP